MTVKESKAVQSRLEGKYNSVSYLEKEDVGFPNYYYELTTEQKFFVDSLMYMLYNREDIEEVVDCIKSAQDELELAVSRLEKV
jgi:hypothetical protein